MFNVGMCFICSQRKYCCCRITRYCFGKRLMKSVYPFTYLLSLLCFCKVQGLSICLTYCLWYTNLLYCQVENGKYFYLWLFLCIYTVSSSASPKARGISSILWAPAFQIRRSWGLKENFHAWIMRRRVCSALFLHDSRPVRIAAPLRLMLS